MPIDRYSATAAAAATNNVILAKGQLGYTADDDVLKVGDGVRHWNDLEAIGGGGGGGLTQEQIEDLVGAMVTGNTETGIAVTYDDATAKLNFAVSLPSPTAVTATSMGTVTTSWAAAGASTTALDVNITAAAGDVVLLGMSGRAAPAAGWLDVDVATIVSSAIVNYASGAGSGGSGVTAWQTPQELNANVGFGGVIAYTVQSGDISSGSVKFRPIAKYEVANRQFAHGSTGPFQFWAVNLGSGSGGGGGGSSYTDESIQDLVGGMVTGNTETGLAVTYDDAAGKLDFVATATSLLQVLEPALAPPASPNAKDDEFDGTSSVTWSNTPTTAGIVSLNTYVPGKLYIGSASTANVVGRVQAIPAGYPFTITTRISDAMLNANFHQAGIVVTTASPTGSSNAVVIGPQYSGGAVGGLRWSGTMGGTYASAGGLSKYLNPPVWFRATFASATSLTTSASADGVNWVTMESAFNPGFTPGVMGLAVSAATVVNMHAVFDFFRVT
jgi:hypothetical protein